MSIVFSCAFGCVVDHEEAITLACGSLPYKCQSCLFGTREPYFKGKNKTENLVFCSPATTSGTHDSTSAGSHLPTRLHDDSRCGECAISRKKKKRKRKHALNVGEVQALKYHEKVREKIQMGMESLATCDEWKNYFHSRELQKDVIIILDGFCGLNLLRVLLEVPDFLQASVDNCELLSAVSNQILKHRHCALYPGEEASHEISDMVNRIICNEKSDSIVISMSGARYLLPGRSTFFLSDIVHLKSFVSELQYKYDLIVIDPPWENKSVKRGTKYSALPLWQIKNMPICDLASNMALIVVWVTNKQKYRKFVLEELFPRWSCKFLAEWHWVKVTRRGETVFDLDSTHKKPYEPLLIGQFDDKIKLRGYPVNSESTGHETFGNEINEVIGCENQTGNSTKNKSKEDSTISSGRLPQHQVICSVPCSQHSRKPPLNDIFSDYLPGKARCIELFARSLLQNWTSWGNEVLKYQHLDYYQTGKR